MRPAARYFVPICLYPHTKYRAQAGVMALFQKYELHSHEYLIVVADRLLVLDRLVTGRYWSVASTIAKARQEAEQVLKLIKRISHKMRAQSGKIVYWDDIANTEKFAAVATRLRRLILDDDLLAGKIENFVMRRVNRFGSGSMPERERDYELEYLLSEICMSIFCTEILGYSDEVWERPPAANVPDPLKLLYHERPELIARVTGRPVARALRFLYADSDREVGRLHEGALAQG